MADKKFKQEHNGWRCMFCGKFRNTFLSIRRHFQEHLRLDKLYRSWE